MPRGVWFRKFPRGYRWRERSCWRPGDTEHLHRTDPLKEYYTSTDLANGAVDNYLRYEKIKKGSSGSEIKVREYQIPSVEWE